MEYKWLRRSAVIFFLITSFFAFSWGRTHLPSPDETANMFFIREYVRTGQLRVAEPLNVIGEDLIHPRAVNIVRHDLVPGGFLGMILLYGWIANIVGLWIVPFLTPLIASIASLFFYKLVRFIFNERIARWSFFILLTHPAWIYYTARSLFPNVLFLSLLIIGLSWLLGTRYWLLSGLLIGAALTVRTAEAGWVLLGLAFLWFFFRKRVRSAHVALFFVGVAIAFLPLFSWNKELYGRPFYNGYSQIDSEAVPAAFAWHFSSPLLSTFFSLLLPFGVKPLVLLSNVYQYGLWFFWWLALPTIFGIVMMVKKEITRYRLLITGYSFITLWLSLYYGSWQFRDTTLVGATLGTSFTRYWLPIFVGGIPFIALSLFTVQRSSLRMVGAVLIFFLSLSTVFTRGDESLFVLRHTVREGRDITAVVKERTEPQAIILTERTDKLFFPERRVIFNDPLDQLKIDRVVARLRKRVSVYYFTALEEHDIDFANRYRFAQYGVAWQGGEETGGQRLYTLEAVSSKQ